MPGLRRAAFGLLLFVGVLGLSLASCATAGVRYVIMALDTNGAYPRTTFYTDSVQIVCVSKVSVGDPDTTLDVIIRQTSAVDWDDNPISGNPMTPVPPQHPLFSATELMPEVGSEETEAVTLLATGTGNAVPCLGYCTVDPPPSYGDPCRATPTRGSTRAASGRPAASMLSRCRPRRAPSPRSPTPPVRTSVTYP